MNKPAFDPADVEAFKDENQRLREKVTHLMAEKELLELQINELEAEVLVQEQLSIRETQGYEHYESLFTQAPIALIHLDTHGKILNLNLSAAELLGASLADLIEENLRPLLNNESSIELISLIKAAQESQQSQQAVLVLAQGKLAVTNIRLFSDASSPSFLLALEGVNLEQLSSQSLALANSVIEQLREAVMITDTRGSIVRVNQAFSQITGYTKEEVLGRSPSLLSSGRHDQHFYQRLWDEIQHHGWWQGEVWNRRKAGDIYPEWLQISRVHDSLSNQNYYVSIFSDISERKTHQDQLDRLAFYDLLTGLPNRTLMNRFLEAKLLGNPGKQDSLAVMFIDLDQFKDVNDHYGHAEGDRVLREATQRLISRVRESDLASRIGGDEFVVVLSRLKSREDAEKVAADLIKQLGQPYRTEKAAHYLSASIGLAFYPSHGQNVEDLMRRADAAMYRAKNSGRNTWQVFDENQEEKILADKKMIRLIWKAIKQPETYFQIHYQPIYSLQDTSKPLEFEALVRLVDEQGQLIFPDQFIQLAEEDAVCNPMGLAILEAVCADLNRYQVAEGLTLCINLSAVQFRDQDLLHLLEASAEKYGRSLSQFNFEVTETALMHNMALMSDLLSELRHQGSLIALDDFGTGYASLSMLRNLPIDILKIDKSFTSELEHSQETQTLVKAMIAVAKALNLKVVTEGVETQTELDWLKEQLVERVQGYLLGKPQPARYWFGGQHGKATAPTPAPSNRATGDGGPSC